VPCLMSASTRLWITAAIHNRAKVTARVECWYPLGADIDVGTVLWVATFFGFALFDKKSPKAAKFNPVTADHGVADFVGERLHHALDRRLAEIRVGLAEAIDDVRAIHVWSPP
jgi:hypothetical protein